MKKLVIISLLSGGLGLASQAEQTSPATTNTTNNAVLSPSTPAWNATPANLDYVGKLGVGLIVGEPTGASVKYFFNDQVAIDGAAGWSFHDHSDFYVHSDILWHKFDLIPVAQGRMPVYFGVGALGRFRDDDHDNQVGIRVPIGVSYMFDRAPVDVFVEVAPAVDLAPNVRADLSAGVGIRYWF